MRAQSNSPLELGDDPGYQRRFWKVQNVGWAVMGLFLVAGLLGLFGGAGPFASATSGGGPNAVTLEHPRFLRARAPIDLDIVVTAGAVQSDQIEIEIDRAYIQRFDIQYINPEPVEVRTGDSTMTYVFARDDPSSEASITLTMQPERFGWATAEIGLVGEPPVEIWQLIYP